MPNAEKRAFQLSNLYYNQGLERAGVRDLTGAVTKLKESLLLNKRNTQARNLLGLVYLEMGEVVAALREWLLSQSYQAKNNPAAEYIRRVRAERTRFQNMRDAIVEYNRALDNCLGGNDDMAAIQLRRALSKNPGMIKAAQLLALIDLHDGKLGEARKVLRRVAKIDRTDPITLRYLKEIEIRVSAKSGKKKTDEMAEEETVKAAAEPAAIKRIRELPSYATLGNVLIGLALGILAAVFLIVPAVKRSAGQELNKRVLDYTTTLAEQKDRLDSLETQIQESDEIVEKARAQVEDSQSEITSYDSLVKGYNFYMGEMYMEAAEELDKVDPSKLSTGAAGIYSGIYNDVQQAAYDDYVFAGSNAFYMENYDEAIKYLEKAISIRLDEPSALELLGLSYGNKGDTQKAIQYFEELIEKFPNTNSADNAAYSIRMLGGETNYGMEGYDSQFDETDYEDSGYEDGGYEESYGMDIMDDAYLSRSEDTGYVDDVDLYAYTDNGTYDTYTEDYTYEEPVYTDQGYDILQQAYTQ